MLGWIINLDFAASAAGAPPGPAAHRKLIDVNTIDKIDVVLGEIILWLILGLSH